MREMFQVIRQRLEQGEDLILVTVVASSGATPRGAGARMLVGRDGRIRGTIGGGAVEYRSLQIAGKVLAEKSSRGQDFSLTRDDVQNLGMICGGNVSVYFHYIPASDPQTLDAARQAEALFARGEDIWLAAELCTEGRVGICTRDGDVAGIVRLREPLERQPRRITQDGREYYVEQINSSGRVFIFGCGHVAQELVPVLAHVGFRCVAMDDREEFARKELFPQAEQVLRIDFEHISDFITVSEDDYICVMTRGHAYDTVVQAQLVKTPACYIGVIGSRHKKAGVFRRLKEEFGCTDEELERITSPIGLSIRAETPAEIAISIAGQMIEHRALRNQKETE